MTAAPRLASEIGEQPQALRRLLAAESGPVDELTAAWRAAGDLRGVMLAARGSSDNAARYGQYVLGAHNRLPVALAAPSLFSRYGRPPRLDGLLVGAISQSGRSPDVVEVVTEAKRQRRPTVAVTNEPSSPLAAEADAVVALHAGEERAVAATKTYTASLAALALLSVGLAGDCTRARQLAAVADRLEEAVATSTRQVEVPDWLAGAPTCPVIARGFNYATAFEVALKLKELTGIAAAPYSSADFLHGPVASVRAGTPAVVIVPSGAVFDDVAAVAGRLRGHGARLAVVSDDERMLAAADLPMPLPAGVPEWLSPLVAVVPGQVLAWRLAEARGRDVDRPAGLDKITGTW